MASYVLVHGVAHGAWCWSTVRDALVDRGHEVIAVDLPLTSLEDDAAEVRRALDAASSPIVLVGHSYGGLVISMAAGGRTDVDHLVYVAAVLVDADVLLGDRFTDFGPSLLMERAVFTDEGQLVIPPEHAIACFYAECPPAAARAAVERLRPTALACISTPPGAEPWRTVPSTYVLCERDHAVPPGLQRWMATRAGTVVTFDTDHSPFMSMPDDLVDVLLTAAEG